MIFGTSLPIGPRSHGLRSAGAIPPTRRPSIATILSSRCESSRFRTITSQNCEAVPMRARV